MKALLQPLVQKRTILSILIDISALAFIYFVPTISHLISLPVYFIEPMRLMLVVALVHTNKSNAYLIALTMPVFSFLISGHPLLPKMILIAFELSLNVFLFYALIGLTKRLFPSILLSIIISKIVYYLLKFGMIQFAIIDSGLISTPIFIQLITTVVFSSYLFIFYRKNQQKRN